MFIYTGTFLRIKQSCPCGYERTWDSQPFIKNLPAGNILLSAAVLFAGATVTKVFKVFRHLGLVSTSVRSFFFHQTKYLQPVVEHVWGQHQSSIVESTRKQQQPINIGGDGRCDSPGHSAKYGCYTIMDLDTNQILIYVGDFSTSRSYRSSRDDSFPRPSPYKQVDILRNIRQINQQGHCY